jgi:hypothetical protein
MCGLKKEPRPEEFCRKQIPASPASTAGHPKEKKETVKVGIISRKKKKKRPLAGRSEDKK